MIPYYKDWPLLTEMPEGWKVDKTCGSPLHNYVFITDGKSVIHGQRRALLMVNKKVAEDSE